MEAAAKALRRLRGVVGVLMEAGQAEVTYELGRLVEETLCRTARSAMGEGCRVSLQPKETWHLKLPTDASTEAAAREALSSVPAVVSVSVRDGRAEVVAFSPRVGTARLLEALASRKIAAEVERETVRVRLARDGGAASPEEMRKVAERLGAVPGVLSAVLIEAGGAGDAEHALVLEIVRERGRAALERLNQRLEDAGFRLES